MRISQIAAAYYFAHFLIILPILSFIEKPLPLPNSIAESVFAKAAAKGGAHAPASAEAAAAPAE